MDRSARRLRSDGTERRDTLDDAREPETPDVEAPGRFRPRVGSCLEPRSDWPALLRGDKTAWDRFVRDAAPVIRAVARRVLTPAGREADLPDVVQDTFVALCRDRFNLLHRFDPSQASLSIYLGVIASRRAVDHLRKSGPAGLDLDEAPAEQLAVEPTPSAGPFRLPVDLLAPRQALILRLLYELDLDVDEVAGRLGITAQTVRSQRHKALQRLRTWAAESSGNQLA